MVRRVCILQSLAKCSDLHRHFIYNFDLYFVEMSLNMSSRINYGMIISYFSMNYIILYLQCPDFMENGRLPHFERSVT